jgi:large subunit ribosomal protein L20
MRVKGGREEAKKHKLVVKAAKGYRLSRSKLYRRAQEALLHTKQYELKDRRKRAAQMRGLWITRINAALRQAGFKYKDFVKALKDSKIELDRKILADLAVNNPAAFEAVIAKSGLKA